VTIRPKGKGTGYGLLANKIKRSSIKPQQSTEKRGAETK
jgi:hypothetical protein